MARPRVFVSSTFYDLRHVRTSIEAFLESLGYEAILSERGQVPYLPDRPLDESCYREVDNCDLFVLILGGRFGTSASKHKSGLSPKDARRDGGAGRQRSITEMEFHRAIHVGKPTYVLIEKSVYAESVTYRKNSTNKTVAYAHVDNVLVHELISEIIKQEPAVPVEQFERPSEIEVWLRAQWAGLFREYLSSRTSRVQIDDLRAEIDSLRVVSETMRRYLEDVVKRVSKTQGSHLVKQESKKLNSMRGISAIQFYQWATRLAGIPPEEVRKLVSDAESFDQLQQSLQQQIQDPTETVRAQGLLSQPGVQQQVNKMRSLLGRGALA